MSGFIDYDELNFAQIYDKEMQVVGADVITGLLHVHCGKPLKDLHVLDAGCGTGHCAKGLTDLGIGKLTLLDASPAMLTVAKDKLKDEINKKVIDQVIQTQIPPLPFEDGTFDAVLYSYVFQEMVTPDDKKDVSVIATILNDTKRIVRPKGMLIMMTQLPSTVRESIWYTQMHPPITEKVLKFYFMSTEEWYNLFEKCGFECVSAMNFLKPNKVNHFDPEGPLNDEWRIGSCAYSPANDEEMKALDNKLLDLKEKGLLKKFMTDHDRTSEMGVTTLFACISN